MVFGEAEAAYQEGMTGSISLTSRTGVSDLTFMDLDLLRWISLRKRETEREREGCKGNGRRAMVKILLDGHSSFN